MRNIGARFTIFDNDEQQFVYGRCYEKLEEALQDAKLWASEDGKNASYSVYELHDTFEGQDA